MGLRTWRSYASERAAALAPLKRGLSHMLNRRLSAGFRRWSEKAFGLRSMGSGLKHLMHRGLSLGWRTLVAHGEEQRALKQKTAYEI